MSPGYRLTRMIWRKPIALLAEGVAYILDRPFILFYVGGAVCWWNALYAAGFPVGEIVGNDNWFYFILIVGSLVLMCIAAAPSRLARLLLIPLMIALEMVFLLTRHYYLFYKVGALFATGFLLILCGEQMAMRRGVLNRQRPDALDHLLQQK